MYDLVVYIGRWQPFHLGHLDAALTALSHGHHLLILVGSSDQARTPKNPWRYEERATMIAQSLVDAGVERDSFTVAKLRDFPYSDERWIDQVRTVVARRLAKAGGTVALFGAEKDASSYYLDLFPEWEKIRHEIKININATDIRYDLFLNGGGLWKMMATRASVDLVSFHKEGCNRVVFNQLQAEAAYYRDYPNEWGAGPFLTADSLVTCAGHVLLIERGRDPTKPDEVVPGEGLWALPGGFVNKSERIFDAAIRELREETGLKVPAPVLRGSIEYPMLFDYPTRSLRGRVVTHVYRIKLRDTDLPKAKGSSDARRAMWVPFSEALSSPEKFFEDHWFILEEML